jgi:cephalosporin-C deacetylase
MDAEATLAHRIQTAPPDGFNEHWAAFREEVAALPRRWRSSIGPDSPGETALTPIPSTRGHAVFARIAVPPDPVEGVAVVLHGAGAIEGFPPLGPDERPPGLPRALLERGLAAVELRVRGVPPSTEVLGELGAEWILHRLESPDAWIVRGAVADVVQAVRCARHVFGEATPLLLTGESLGGGLAVLAAAQLEQMEIPLHRLVVGLPSLGDWRWRMGRHCAGSGGLVNERLLQLREDAELAQRSLELHDAAHHARFVTTPCLCKLADRDEVVPAPAAAAVVNALSSKDLWRFAVRFGHYEGGLADLRRHAAFERLQAAWLRPRTTLNPSPHDRFERRDPVHGRWIS